MTIEQKLKETLQSKSHLFSIGQNNYHLNFIKTKDGEIEFVSFCCIGSNSLPRAKEEANGTIPRKIRKR